MVTFMPHNTRGWAKRKILMASANLDTAGMHLEEVSQRYVEAHPEIANSITGIQEIIANTIKFIERLEDEI